jgi:hypothetical protein
LRMAFGALMDVTTIAVFMRQLDVTWNVRNT